MLFCTQINLFLFYICIIRYHIAGIHWWFLWSVLGRLSPNSIQNIYLFITTRILCVYWQSIIEFVCHTQKWCACILCIIYPWPSLILRLAKMELSFFLKQIALKSLLIKISRYVYISCYIIQIMGYPEFLYIKICFMSFWKISTSLPRKWGAQWPPAIWKIQVLYTNENWPLIWPRAIWTPSRGRKYTWISILYTQHFDNISFTHMEIQYLMINQETIWETVKFIWIIFCCCMLTQFWEKQTETFVVWKAFHAFHKTLSALETVFKNTIVNSWGLKVPKCENFDSVLPCLLTQLCPL